MLLCIMYNVEDAKRKLEAYCAYQDRCHKEVITKLKSMNMIPLAIDVIVNHLIEHEFLNEERFAKSFVRGKFRHKKWGKIRLVRELKMREISRFNIDIALKEITSEAYFNTFHELAEKKWNATNENNILKKKKKVLDYLLYRGWETHLIYEKLQDLEISNKKT
ncbi:regulatory protein RecX [Zhouia sp. PK063]|uniref:regulatory protein RecX n=1 Tax=Zhouia sp. PK063 TaxID=3373602 RepID=UPI00378F081A